MKNLKGQGGITLVALVVTIIVLLILAGVTILYVMSDNGIFGKAADARTNTNKSVVQEIVMNAILEAQAEYYDPASEVDVSTATAASTFINSRINAAGITGSITLTSFNNDTTGTANAATGDELTYNGQVYTVKINTKAATGSAFVVEEKADSAG